MENYPEIGYQGYMIINNLTLTSLTIYQSYVQNLFAQIYIHSPQGLIILIWLSIVSSHFCELYR